MQTRRSCWPSKEHWLLKIVLGQISSDSSNSSLQAVRLILQASSRSFAMEGQHAFYRPWSVFFHDQVKRLEEESTLADNFFSEEEPLPEGKFQVEQPKVPQVPLQPIMGTAAHLTPILLAGMAEAANAT